MPSHKAGALKQSNKKHKGTSGKRSQNRALGAGRVSGSASVKSSNSKETISSSLKNSRLSRLNQSHQLRNQKKSDVWLQKRLGSNQGPPKIVGIIPLSARADSAAVLASCLSQASWQSEPAQYSISSSSNRVVYAHVAKHRSKFTFIEASRDMFEVLDVARVADILVFVTTLNDDGILTELIDEIGHSNLDAIRAIGFPAVVCTIKNLSSTSNASAKRLREITRFIEGTIAADVRVVDPDEGAQLLLRHLSGMSSSRELGWRATRSYMAADSVVVATHNEQAGLDSAGSVVASHCSVQMTGYLRGKPFLLHSLCHIVGVGACRVSRVDILNAGPLELAGRPHHAAAVSLAEDGTQSSIVASAYADPTKQDSLVMEAAGDGIQGEQTWPTEKEMDAALAADGTLGRDRRKIHQQLPEGMSAYQADWFLDEKGEFDASAADGVQGGQEWRDDEDADADDDKWTVDGSALGINQSAEAAALEKKRLQAAREHQAFPDEMDTPEDMSARLRFARYRALQSFRSSPWHCKENLPQSYARIYQFEDFNGMQRKVLGESRIAEDLQNQQVLSTQLTSKATTGSKSKSRSGSWSLASSTGLQSGKVDTESMAIEEAENEDEAGEDEDEDREIAMMNLESGKVSETTGNVDQFNGFLFGSDDYIVSGQYVRVWFESVDAQIISKMHGPQLISWFGLLTHENKLSVLNYQVQRVAGFDEPIKSKDELLFVSGFRSFTAKPIFSEANLNCDKNKLERYLLPNTFSIASVFGPITYTPCPLLVFRVTTHGQYQLVATGSLSNVNPDRIVLKKIVLSGVPIRVRKRFAVVKAMFFDPQDVRWFKPAELVTKHGLRGHITESVGTHGLFKAQFSAPITQNDTVLLILYKRVYPKLPEAGVIVN